MPTRRQLQASTVLHDLCSLVSRCSSGLPHSSSCRRPLRRCAQHTLPEIKMWDSAGLIGHHHTPPDPSLHAALSFALIETRLEIVGWNRHRQDPGWTAHDTVAEAIVVLCGGLAWLHCIAIPSGPRHNVATRNAAAILEPAAPDSFPFPFARSPDALLLELCARIQYPAVPGPVVTIDETDEDEPGATESGTLVRPTELERQRFVASNFARTVPVTSL